MVVGSDGLVLVESGRQWGRVRMGRQVIFNMLKGPLNSASTLTAIGLADESQVRLGSRHYMERTSSRVGEPRHLCWEASWCSLLGTEERRRAACSLGSATQHLQSLLTLPQMSSAFAFRGSPGARHWLCTFLLKPWPVDERHIDIRELRPKHCDMICTPVGDSDAVTTVPSCLRMEIS